MQECIAETNCNDLENAFMAKKVRSQVASQVDDDSSQFLSLAFEVKVCGSTLESSSTIPCRSSCLRCSLYRCC